MKKFLLFLLPLAFLIPIQGQAATLDDLVKEIRATRQELIEFLGAAKDVYLDYLFEENPSYPATVAANTAQTSVKEKVSELSKLDIKNALTQENLYNKTTLLSRMPASDSTLSADVPSTTSVFGTKKPGRNVNAGDANLDVASLLSPVTYKTDLERNAASRFIQFSTSLVDPLTSINNSKLSDTQKKKLEESPEGRAYRVYLRTLVAERSIAMNNLLRMYAARLPVTDLGKDAGIPEEDKKDASPLEVQEYKATRRVNSPDWYKSMSKAASATVQRETLYVLAEIREQLFRMQQDNERVLLMLSMMELQNIQMLKLTDKNKESLGLSVLSK